MKRLIALLLILPLGSYLRNAPEEPSMGPRIISTADSDGMRVVENKAFEVGEVLKYKLHYGLVNAGVAKLKVHEVTNKEGRTAYHIVGTGGSVGMFNLFYKVDDRYETYIDTSALVPLRFIRDVNEGGYEINRDIRFNHQVDTAFSDGKAYRVPDNIQDLLSAFYYSRTFDVTGIQIGDEFEITTFLDHEVFPLRLRYLGDETVKTKFGEIECMKFMPIVQVGRVFEDTDGMWLWVSKDQNHVPVRMQSDLLIGSIRMDLIDYKGTKTPLVFK